MKKESKKNKETICTSMLIIGVFLVFMFLEISYCKRIIDSDMSSEMVLANLLNKENTIISKNWIYGSELRVIHMQLLFKIALKIFPSNWVLARIVSQSVLMALYALSSIFCIKEIGLGKKSIYITAILLLPLGFWNVFHNYFGGFYLVFAIPTLLLIGFTFKILKQEQQNIVNVIIYFLFSLLIGLNGTKVLLYFCFPCFVTAFLFLSNKVLKEKSNFDTLKESYELRYFIISIINVLGMLIGYLGYRKLCSIYDFYLNEPFIWQKFSITNILNNLSSYFMCLGYPSNEYFGMNIDAMTINGILGTFGLLLICVFAFSIVKIISRYEKINILYRMLFVLCLTSILLTAILLTCLYSDTNGSYFIPLIPHAFLIIELEIVTEDISNNSFRNILRISLLICALLSSIPNVNWYIKKHPRRDKDLNRAVSYLIDNEIESIYAEFWDGNVITELTNGRINAYVVEDYKTLRIYNLLQEKSHINEYPKSNIYVLIDGEVNFDSKYKEKGIETIYCDEYSIIKAKDIDTYLNNIK